MPREFNLQTLVRIFGVYACLLGACSDKTKKAPATETILPVQVISAMELDWPRVVSVPATVSATDTAALASRAGGWVARVDVDAGAHVAQGELIAEVGASDALGQLAEMQSRLTTAEATWKEAADNERRSAGLYRAHTTPAQQYEAVRRHLIATQAEVAAATSALAVAKSNLGYAEIRAPFAGIVAEKNVWPGDFASPGATLFVLASDHREIRAHVGPATYDALKIGDKAEVVIDGKTLPAVLTLVVAAADPKSRTHLVELHLQDDATAPYGAYAELRLTLGRLPTLTVPETAVTRRAGLLGVFVVDEAHRAHFRLVRVGEGRDGRIAVMAGLAAGEEVVAAPTAELVNNSPVAPQAAPEPMSAGTTRD